VALDGAGNVVMLEVDAGCETVADGAAAGAGCTTAGAGEGAVAVG
jgi:hypothetical protein